MANPSLQIGNSKWAIKEDNLLGYSTAGTRFLPIPITMTRQSAGTRVNPQGLVETVELLSEELTDNNFLLTGTQAENTTGTYWTTGTGWTISGGSALRSGASSNSSIEQTISIVSGKTYLLSYDRTYISGGGATNLFSDFITDGVSVTIGILNSTIQEKVKVTAQFTPTYTGTLNIRLFGIGTFNGTIDNVSVKESTRNDLARVDYTGSTSSLLVEPIRTNLLPYSEDLSEWNFISGGAVDTINYGTSPDGTLNSTRLVFSSDNLQYSNTLTTGSSTVGSIYMKGVSGETIAFGMQSSESLFTFDGTWQRFEKTGTATSNKITINTFGGATARDFEVWGGQVEAGSYATSYIPTSGGTVTRVQDQYSKTGISDKIGAEGVLFIEMAALSNDLTNRVISLNDGTSSNRLMLYFNSLSNTIAAAGIGGTISYTVTDETAFNKMAVRYKENDITLWVDGESRGTPITSVTIPTFTALKFDSGSGSSDFYGKVKQLQIYDTYLSNGDMQTLTT